MLKVVYLRLFQVKQLQMNWLDVRILSRLLSSAGEVKATIVYLTCNSLGETLITNSY